MTEQNEIHPHPLVKRILQGASLAFVLVTIFLFAGGFAEDSGILTLVPMGTVTIGGAFGGTFYFIMDHLRSKGGMIKLAGNILSVLVYVFLLWFSLIPGLAVTGHWN